VSDRDQPDRPESPGRTVPDMGRPATPDEKSDPLQEQVVHPGAPDVTTAPGDVPAVDDPDRLRRAPRTAAPDPAGPNDPSADPPAAA
jgi:hypothetical protein